MSQGEPHEFAFIPAGVLGRLQVADRKLIRRRCMIGKNKKKQDPRLDTPGAPPSQSPPRKRNRIPIGPGSELTNEQVGLETVTAGSREKSLVRRTDRIDLMIPTQFPFEVSQKSRDQLVKCSFRNARPHGRP